MMSCLLLTIVLIKVGASDGAVLDIINCGVDDDVQVTVGDVPITMYPWLGILYYSSYTEYSGEIRAVTSVALIHREFVIAPAADIAPMPKHDFRLNSRVLIGEGWNGEEYRVRSYVIHPEYGETYNTIALVQLKRPVKDLNIHPLCPPPDLLRNPEFYLIKFHDVFESLDKEVIPVEYVPGNMCKDFYVTAHLYTDKMRPSHVVCAISLEQPYKVCVWEAGGVLAARDVWGRWQLLGLGIRGPGCGAPSRYLDMMGYYPWIEASLAKFRQVTISKIHDHKYVIRSGGGGGEDEGEYGAAVQRFGACDPEEKKNLIYREVIVLRTDNNQYQFMTYNMTLLENVEYSCLTLELVNASAVSEFRIQHSCIRDPTGEPCYRYKGSVFDISVYMMFSDKCRFEMNAWGWKKNMSLIDIQAWKWEEGTYYDDFSMTRVEYRGPTDQTLFGFEPLDEKMWVPEYDYWTTTEYSNMTTTTPVPPVVEEATLVSIPTKLPKIPEPPDVTHFLMDKIYTRTEDPTKEKPGYGLWPGKVSKYQNYMKMFPDYATTPEEDSEFLLGVRWKRNVP